MLVLREHCRRYIAAAWKGLLALAFGVGAILSNFWELESRNIVTVAKAAAQDRAAAGPGKPKAKTASSDMGGRPPAFHLTIDTALLQLEVSYFDLDKAVSGGASFAVIGDRILLADQRGHFYEVDMGMKPPRVRALPAKIDLHEDHLLANAAGRGFIDVYLLRILDLATFDHGTQIAVIFTRWNDRQQCASLFVAVNRLPKNWAAMAADGWRTVFESRPCLQLRLDGGSLFGGHQAGGRVLETAPGTLLITVGDFEYDGVNRKPAYPQDPDSSYGKTFEIDVASGTSRPFTSGHRNPQGLWMDAHRRLWSTEHGPQGGDELNLLANGGNYGWPLVTYGTSYGSTTWPPSSRQGRHDEGRFRSPQYAWVPSIGISNLILVENFAPEWNGDLLVESLSGQLRRLRLNGDNVVYDEPIPIGERLRDIGQLADGRIVIWADSDQLIVIDKPATLIGTSN